MEIINNFIHRDSQNYHYEIFCETKELAQAVIFALVDGGFPANPALRKLTLSEGYAIFFSLYPEWRDADWIKEIITVGLPKLAADLGIETTLINY